MRPLDVNQKVMKIFNESKRKPITEDVGDSGLSVETWQGLLAFDRMLVMTYQTFHWCTKGKDFYEDHLLFERLYNDTSGDIDSIGEKAIGTTQKMATVDPLESITRMHSKLDEVFSAKLTPEAFIGVAITLEEEFLGMLGSANSEDGISIGTQNFIQGLYDKHEDHLYLLKQTVAGTTVKPETEEPELVNPVKETRARVRR